MTYIDPAIFKALATPGVDEVVVAMTMLYDCDECEECRQRHADEAAEHAYDLWREREAS